MVVRRHAHSIREHSTREISPILDKHRHSFPWGHWELLQNIRRYRDLTDLLGHPREILDVTNCWWSPETIAEFQEEAHELVKVYYYIDDYYYYEFRFPQGLSGCLDRISLRHVLFGKKKIRIGMSFAELVAECGSPSNIQRDESKAEGIGPVNVIYTEGGNEYMCFFENGLDHPLTDVVLQGFGW
jgi:hypothetical protein